MITDYEPFLRVTEDGHIRWLLKDAIRLGAGFLPVRDDHQTLAAELRAPNNRARLNERTLIDAFGATWLPIERPMTFERDGFHYVEATSFLNWLAQYIEQTQVKITFPNELGREVSIAKAKAAASRPAVASQEFKSLTLALESWFDKNLDDLPLDLHQRVEREFFPMPWDGLSADQRRSAAIQKDYQCDPATEEERQYWWNFFTRLDNLKEQVEQWQSAATPTASDIALKESRLKELQQEIDRMELQQQVGGDYFPERDSLVSNKETIMKTDYIAYPKAMKMLRKKWQATPEELAIWIFLGPEDGGIVAYLNAHELHPPREFSFAYVVGCENYLSPLMACWFRQDDIDRFTPKERYITGKELLKRWGKLPYIQGKAFIVAKIAESRLVDLHPIFGGTRGTFDEQQNFPPLKSGIFALSEIKQIENEDFGLAAAPPTTPKTGGRPQSIMTESVERVYLHFRDRGDLTPLRPGSVRQFLKLMKSLATDEVQKGDDGLWKLQTYLAERIKEVKYSATAECFVVTHDRPEGKKINPGDRYSQNAIAKLLTGLRKKYPLPS